MCVARRPCSPSWRRPVCWQLIPSSLSPRWNVTMKGISVPPKTSPPSQPSGSSEQERSPTTTMEYEVLKKSTHSSSCKYHTENCFECCLLLVMKPPPHCLPHPRLYVGELDFEKTPYKHATMISDNFDFL